MKVNIISLTPVLSKDYAVFNIYILSWNKSGNILAKLIVKAYILEQLDIKLLLDTDILRADQINILLSCKKAYIGGCNIYTNIEVAPQDLFVRHYVQIKDKVTVLSFLETRISVQFAALL